MDCPSEENLIRMKLDELAETIVKLDFKIEDRGLLSTMKRATRTFCVLLTHWLWIQSW